MFLDTLDIKRQCEICQHLPREHILEALYNISRILSGQAAQQQMLIGVLDALEQQLNMVSTVGRENPAINT
ncbi:hypothetical protein TI05_09965 [Achromatium sp. WMS3]|nr:hypothetical protein TI05_09965 [Achromatium sp. WMS3]